jgi:hypothetical protein
VTAQKGAGSSIATFFLLLLMLSIPFWVLGEIVRTQDLPINLPFSALMAFNPMIIALILLFRQGGGAHVQDLLRHSVDFRNIRPRYWYALIFLLMPAVLLVSYGLQVLLGRGISNPEFSILTLPILVFLFTLSAYGEEVGWQGYAFERMQPRWGTVGTGVIIGIAWAIWHLIPFIQTGNSAWWIFWQCVFTIVFRLVIVQIYIGAGRSIFAAVMTHAMYNVAVYMTPNFGSGYDPLVTTLIIGLALLAAYQLEGK